MFFKSLYSVREVAELLNSYFSVKTFSPKDVVNMFFAGDIDFSVRCMFTSLIGVTIDDDLLHCDVSLNGIDLENIEHGIKFTDTYAEINSLYIDGKCGLIGGGLFNINKDLAATKKEPYFHYTINYPISGGEYGNNSEANR